MSEVAALAPFDDFHSAHYFRDLYLRDETRYTEFFCPFCSVPLLEVLVYASADQEMGTSPHFRTKRGGAKHYPGCDGNPSDYQHSHDKKPIQGHIEKRHFSIPTEFLEYIERPHHPLQYRPTPIPTPDEIQRRREAAGRIYGTARFRVSLVQSLAEAQLAVLTEAYNLQKENGWSNEKRESWIKAILQAPINLRGSSTTYRNAFHNLWFPIPRHPRVFHGKDAKIIAINGGYELLSERSGKIEGTNLEKPFTVVIFLEEIEVGQLRGARKVLFTRLQRAATENMKVRWYAYGLARLTGLGFELQIDQRNIGDLFIK